MTQPGARAAPPRRSLTRGRATLPESFRSPSRARIVSRVPARPVPALGPRSIAGEPKLIRRRPVYAAFALSGVAGLVYEVLWSRYLGLFVGNGAYAQVLVLSVYLGGMAVGSIAVSDFSQRLRRPLLWYAGAEVLLAVFGLCFHALFVLATETSYDLLFPTLGSARIVGALRWGVAGGLILPQAVVLGATFPLMAAGLVRADATHPGGGVARAYLLNTLGGAIGVVLAGFWMIGGLGLPGTSVAAALLNLIAAGLVWSGLRTEPHDASGVEAGSPAGPRSTSPAPALRLDDGSGLPHWVGRPARLSALLLTVSFGTALASFAYEIGWIRMLSLVLGSATHAFELMLSAFILGLALGAWMIRRRVDRVEDPIRVLGWIQVLMGLAALVSLPLYTLSFDVVSVLVRSLPGQPGGYAAFNLSRYALCLMVMLPSTTLAGMTLPVITGSLLRAGRGERAIGRVYGVSTIGSVAGAGLAGLLALPLLGLEGLIEAGAAVDVALGLLLLLRSVRVSAGRPVALIGATAACAVIFAGIGTAVELTPTLLASGVYREGELPTEEEHRSLYYQDGRTATVSAHVGTGDGVIVLATNGKPDASIGPRWLMEGRDTLPLRPIPAGRDFTTQVLAPMVALAHRSDARTVANIGHGSGMSATSFLTSPSLERLVTIEIEPLMVEGSLVFLPANGPAFGDPRATYVFDDAKSFFAYRQERFDVIFAEPSNPWVSGTASLFTREFYERATDFLDVGGVFGQWVQIYELNDDLFLSVLAAIDAVFPSYRAYLVGDADIAIVARADGPLDDPDWSVVSGERFGALIASAPPFTPASMESLLLFDETTFRALLDRGAPVNSDYRPVLDAGAEHARFLRTHAEGAYSFVESRVDLGRALSGVEMPPAPYAMVPAYGLLSAVLWGRAAWLREALEGGGGIAPEEFPEWTDELLHMRAFLDASRGEGRVGSWEAWALGFARAEATLHWGTSGWIEPNFYGVVERFLDRADAPAEARAAVALTRSFSLGDWNGAAAAADRLVYRVAAGEGWAMPAVLMDMAVLSYVRAGSPTSARSALRGLAPRAGRSPQDLRFRLLEAIVDQAERERRPGPA